MPRNGEWVPERDNSISAVHSPNVRSTTKNTDAIFTAYVIESVWSRAVCAWAPRATPASAETEAEYLGESVSNFDMTTFALSRYRDFAESRGPTRVRDQTASCASAVLALAWRAFALFAGSPPDSAWPCPVLLLKNYAESWCVQKFSET